MPRGIGVMVWGIRVGSVTFGFMVTSRPISSSRRINRRALRCG